MNSVADVLNDVKRGKISVRKAESILKFDSIAVINDIARIDYNRYLRRGVPEIIYAQNKSIKQISLILQNLLSKRYRDSMQEPIILSKVRRDQVKPLKHAFESMKDRTSALKYLENANLIAICSKEKNQRGRIITGKVALLAAGTSDISVLNESEVLLNLFECRTIRFNDVGVAGLHRLVEPMKKILNFNPDAVIVAAGMEGALSSVVAGLVSVPVIGLPTSVGYGYGGKGESALMSMLQACSLGISVVNIDAGVAAGVVAWLVAKRKHLIKQSE
jgi:NCAIR mutase (PurE)-related protein